MTGPHSQLLWLARPGAAETTYRDIDETLTSPGPDRHTDAIEIAAARVDADLGLLSGGVI